MAKTRQAGQPWRAWRRKFFSLGALALAPLFGAGCTPTQVTGVQQPADPLVGVMAPPGMPRPTNLPATTPESPASSPNYNSSQAPTSSNPATLASLSGWTGPGGRPLAINDNSKAGQLTSSSKSGDGYLPPNPHPRVERVPDVNPSQPAVTPTASWQTPQGPTNDAAWVKQLQDRGVIDQKREPTPEGIHLTCYVQRESGVRILEVVAPDYPLAAQAILRQLDGK